MDYKKIIEGDLAQKIAYFTGIEEKYIKKIGLGFALNHPKTITKTKAQWERLCLLNSLIKQYNEVSFVNETIKIINSQSAGEYFVSRLSNVRDVEKFDICFLNVSSNIIKTETFSTGTINEVVLYPREIIKKVLEYDASSIIIAHNHPGDSLNPSLQDVELTRKLKEALETINVHLLDHIIVAGKKFYSFAQNRNIIDYSKTSGRKGVVSK